MTLKSCIKRDKMRVFRRLYMKRRQSDGDYESTWQTIPSKYIKRWGSIKISVDEVIPNFYKYGGPTFQVLNNDGFFSGTGNEDSFWFGYLTQYRTLIKIEAGYIDTDDTEYPTVPTLFVGFISEDFKYSQNNVVPIKSKHIASIFDEFPADRIVGLGTTQTASDVITKIRDHLDSNSISIFQKYITTGGWNIATTTNNFDMATTTTLQGKSCWKLMQGLAAAENHVVYINQVGDFYFEPRTDIGSTASFHFSGLADEDKTWGHNVMKKISIDYGIRKVYNRVKVKHLSDDTITSYYVKNESWDWADSSSSFLYGVREYKYENLWLNSVTAQTIGDGIYDAWKNPKLEVKIESKFVPQLYVMDSASLTYKTKKFVSGDRWKEFYWDSGFWGGGYGYNINISDTEYWITNLEHVLEKFKSKVTLKEI